MTTRLGLYGGPRPPYGSFEGKAEFIPAEPPPVRVIADDPFATYDPLANLPAGRVPTREDVDAIMQAYADNAFEPLDDETLEMILGEPLRTPEVRREFGTGDYPTATRYRHR